jgi:hypothetical protein
MFQSIAVLDALDDQLWEAIETIQPVREEEQKRFSWFRWVRRAILFVSPSSLHVKAIGHWSKEGFNNHLCDIRLCPSAVSSICRLTRAIER